MSREHSSGGREPAPIHAALLYASMGWPVLPLHTSMGTVCSCRRKDCASVGKHPRLRDGVYGATTDLDHVERLWARWPDANVGIATGAIVVIDVDGDQGHAAIRELEDASGPLPRTCVVATARGFHVYFDAGGRELGNSASGLPPGIDARGHGGYVVAPPSRHRSGHTYHWVRGSWPAPLPEWLEHVLTAAPTDRAR